MIKRRYKLNFDNNNDELATCAPKTQSLYLPIRTAFYRLIKKKSLWHLHRDHRSLANGM